MVGTFLHISCFTHPKVRVWRLERCGKNETSKDFPQFVRHTIFVKQQGSKLNTCLYLGTITLLHSTCEDVIGSPGQLNIHRSRSGKLHLPTQSRKDLPGLCFQFITKMYVRSRRIELWYGVHGRIRWVSNLLRLTGQEQPIYMKSFR